MIGKLLRQSALVISTAIGLSACGGGGDPGIPDFVPIGSGYAIDIDVIDPNSGAETTTLNTAKGNTINITLTEDGAPLAGELVTVTSSVGAITPSGGSVLTDSSGNASVTVSSTGVDAGTGGTITASYNNFEEELNIEVGNTITGGGGTTGSVVTLTATLYDARAYAINPSSPTAETDRINVVQPGTLEVLFELDGLPQANVIVTVTTDKGELTPSSGQVITNSSGIATVEVGVGSAQSGEGGTLTITSAGETETVTFGIGSASLQLGTGSGAGFTSGALNITNTSLSATGNAGISVNVVDGSNALFTTPVDVSFTSDCINSGQATIDSPVTTSGGTANASYSVSGCEGNDTIIATIDGVAGPSANGQVNIIASIPNSISFSSATPTNIALKGTGGSGRLETADVVFAVIDNTGNPEPGVIVNFALSTDTGGIQLVDDTGQSNSVGEVTAKVSAGNIPTPVRVIATISLDANGNSVPDTDNDGFSDTDGTTAVVSTISTVSDVLVISTGIPDQDSFTISATIINPGGGDTNGVQSVISIAAADKFNNPVPDGTAINFTTEFGSIEPSCNTVNGGCSVTWRSQNPRAHLTFTADDITQVTCNTTSNGNTIGIPCREDSDFAIPNGAYTSILAYALGEETFVDANGNGLFDTGEVFDDISEVFLDHNDDGEFGNSGNAGSCSPTCPVDGGDEEIFIDFDSDGLFDSADSIYNGSLCSTSAASANACTKSLLNVSDSLFLVMSSQAAYFGLYDAAGTLVSGSGLNSVVVDVSLNPASLFLDISDHFNGPLPSGTSVSLSSTNCDIDSPTNYTFGDGSLGFLTIPIVLSEDTTTEEDFGLITIAVNTPTTNALSGVTSSFSFSCRDQN